MLLLETETKGHNTSQKRYMVRVTGSESRGAQVIHSIDCQRVRRHTYVRMASSHRNIPHVTGTFIITAATDHRPSTINQGIPQSMRTGRDGTGEGWMSQDASDGRDGTVGTVRRAGSGRMDGNDGGKDAKDGRGGWEGMSRRDFGTS